MRECQLSDACFHYTLPRAAVCTTTALPAALAVPWLRVCVELGLPPVLCASVVDMWNWVPPPPGAPFEPAQLSCISTMTGTQAEVMFHMLPCAMQNAAGPLVARLLGVPALLRAPGCGGARALALLLRDVAAVLRTWRRFFAEVHSLVDRAMFYDVYRPLLGGVPAPRSCDSQAHTQSTRSDRSCLGTA